MDKGVERRSHKDHKNFFVRQSTYLLPYLEHNDGFNNVYVHKNLTNGIFYRKTIIPILIQ